MELYKLINSFCRNYPAIEGYTLRTLLMSDPTFKQTYKGLFVGRYGVWIGDRYANGCIKLGDIPELKAALVTYDKNKSQLPPLKDCKSLSELIEWIKNLSDDFKPVRKQSNAKANLEKVYEDNEWVVYIPHSHAAARRGGENTYWCTASENPDYYNMYSRQGSLYINIRKFDGAKFQFHFESNQFMDANDEPIRLNEIELPKGVVNFYSKIEPTFKFRVKFDYVGIFYEGFAEVKLNGKWNFINLIKQTVFKQWFDYTWHFYHGFAIVKLNGKYNFINTKGQLLSQQWLDWVNNFTNGFTKVELDCRYNFINTEGQLLSKQWFDAAWNFNDGFASVKINNKYNFINTNGQLLSQQWFDDIGEFNDGFASVQLNNKWKLIDTDGKFFEY